MKQVFNNSFYIILALILNIAVIGAISFQPKLSHASVEPNKIRLVIKNNSQQKAVAKAKQNTAKPIAKQLQQAFVKPAVKKPVVKKRAAKKLVKKQITKPIKKVSKAISRPATVAKKAGAKAKAFTPLAIRKVDPVYPKALERRGVQGKVVLSAVINGQGKAQDIVVKASSGNSQLDESALVALRQWVFNKNPNFHRGVKSTVDVPFNFVIR